MENREGIRHAAGSVSELVVCTTVLGTSFAAVVKKEILEEGQEGKRNAVTLGPAHHEVAVGAQCRQGGEQCLGRRQHEADVAEFCGRAIGVHGHCRDRVISVKEDETAKQVATREDKEAEFKVTSTRQLFSPPSI